MLRNPLLASLAIVVFTTGLPGAIMAKGAPTVTQRPKPMTCKEGCADRYLPENPRSYRQCIARTCDARRH